MDNYKQRIHDFDESYQQSDLKNDADFESPLVSPLTDADRDEIHIPWCYQFGLLLKRNFLNTIRLPQTSYVKLAVVVVTALFTVILFYNVDDNLQGV